MNKPTECTLTNEELLEKCEQWISDMLRSGGKCWTLHIPARPNHDPDLLFSELITRFRAQVPKDETSTVESTDKIEINPTNIRTLQRHLDAINSRIEKEGIHIWLQETENKGRFLYTMHIQSIEGRDFENVYTMGDIKEFLEKRSLIPLPPAPHAET